MEKLANSATAALPEWDGLQKWLKINDVKHAQATAQAKKPRHKIPAEGLIFDKDAELGVHFSRRHLEDLANINAQHSRSLYFSRSAIDGLVGWYRTYGIPV